MAPQRFPVVKHLCECTDCSLHPDPCPVTGLPSTGRYIPERELKQHGRIEEKRGIAAAKIAPYRKMEPPDRYVGLSEPSNLRPFTGYQRPSAPARPTPYQKPTAPRSSRTASTTGSSRKSPPSTSPVDLSASKAIDLMLEELHNADKVLEESFATLTFQKPPPTTQLEPIPSNFEEILALDTSVASNSHVIGFIDFLSRARAYATSQKKHEQVTTRLRADLLRRTVDEKQKRLQKLLLAEWKRQKEVSSHTNVFDTSHFYTNKLHLFSDVVLAIYLIVSTLHLLSNISIDDCTFLLKSFALVASLQVIESSSRHCMNPASKIHLDIRRVVGPRGLDLSPRSRAYICCPQCFKLYWVDPSLPASSRPEVCTSATFSGICGVPLRKKRKTATSSQQAPIREFHHQEFNEYLGRLFSRPDLQDYLYLDPSARKPDDDFVWDIWDAKALRNFKDADGSTFIEAPDGESRLLFSLNMDGFNPYRNKEAGKKVTVGALYMVCLNLPPAIRYDLENIYLVGVIPGPQAPSQHELNHILRPLVKDLLLLWNPGTHLTRTHRFPHGYNVRAALAPLVCDLPASRQTCGFAHYRSNKFCSECHQVLDDINDLDVHAWERRTWEEHHEWAFKWKSAGSLKEREKIANDHGVRWSELLRLPYWDPTMFTMIDSMHAFYLRLFQHHCRSVWGMDINYDDGDGITFDRTGNQPTEAQMKHGNHVLRHGTADTLKALTVPVLRELCRQTSTLNFRGKKKLLLKRLTDYRVRQGWFTEAGEYISDHDGGIDQDEPSVEVGNDSELQLSNGRSIDEFFANASKGDMRLLKKVDALKVFRRRVMPMVSPPMSEEFVSRLGKDVLKEYIQNERKRLGLIAPDGSSPATAPRKTRVLGKGVLAEIRRDMERLQVPTWQARAPKRPGEKKWGKFTADQWRTFCLINLPITLIRLWGDKPAGSIERRRLENFMHLVTAVKLATMHKLDEDRISQYEYHIHRYLTTLLELYPGTTITPYQHLALHLGRQLRDFGPVHAWRCFPFERYNFVMQNVPKNMKFGEMETTMFTRFCSSQNIRAIYKAFALPDALKPLIEIFNKRYGNDCRGTRLNDALTHNNRYEVFDSKPRVDREETAVLPNPIYDVLQGWYKDQDPSDRSRITKRVRLHTSFKRLGQRFTTHALSKPDSFVVFTDSKPEEWKAGRIRVIFSHSGPSGDQHTFAVIDELEELEDDLRVHDHYREFSVAGGRLFKPQCKPESTLVNISQIKCHFACCPSELVPGPLVRLNCVVVLPLDKV